MSLRGRFFNSPRSEKSYLPVTRLLICLLAAASVAGAVGAVWLLALRPALGLRPPASPGLTILEFLVIGIVAGGLVLLLFRHALFGPTGRHEPPTDELKVQIHVAEEDRVKTLTAIVDRLDHKLNNALMVIRGQAEVFLRRDPDSSYRKGLERIIEHADVISDELKALGELKQIEEEDTPDSS